MNILWFGPPVPAKSDHARQSNDATRLGTVGHMSNRRRNTSQTATFVRIGGQEAGGLLLGAKGAGAAAGSWILLVALLVACLFFNWLAILPVLILIGGAIIAAGRHTWASILTIMLLALLGFSSGLFFWWSYYVRIDAARTNEPTPVAADWNLVSLAIFGTCLAGMYGIGVWGRRRKQQHNRV